MKNRILSFFVMICFVASCFVSCGNFNGGSSDNSGNSGDNGSGTNDNGTNVTITETSISIWITSYPDKVYYQVNEPFDSTGLAIESTIIEKYSDGTEKTFTEEIVCPNENITFSGTDFSTVGTKNITVIYTKNEMTAYTSFEVNVGEGSLISNTFDSISIKTLPTKTEYKVNEEFDPTGLEITAIYTNYYSDNSTMSYSNDISYDNNMTFSGTDFSTVGTKTITVTYTENETSQFATFQITVKAAAFSSIINYTTFDSEINSDLSIYNGKAMTLYLDTTTVNIATLYTQFTTLLDAVKAGSVAISYGDAGKTTIEGEFLMTALVDTTATKEVEKYAKIKSFVNAITPKTQDFPKISADIGGRNLNLYHTGIVDLFNLYFENSAGDKLPDYDNMYLASSYFDALDYLNANGGIAYDANGDYTGNYYNLNVNAALLMGVSELKNVNIINTVSVADNEFQGEFTNVRFAENTSGFTFSDSAKGIGLIEFAGDAPSMTPRVDSGRLVLRKVNKEVSTSGGFSIDVSDLSVSEISNYLANDDSSFTESIYATEEAKNAAGYISSSVRVGGELVSGTDYYATNQQWIDAANKNEWIEKGSKRYPNKEKLISKLNLDEKNNNNKLLNTILFNNQKVYG